MRVFNESLQASTTDLSTSQTLMAVNLNQVFSFAIQLVFTGIPDGSFKLQASCDPGNISQPILADQSSRVINWTDIVGSSTAVSAAGDIMYIVENPAYAWIRVVYTADTAGTTPLLTVARINGKAF